MPKVKQINPNAKYYPPRLLDKLSFVKDYPLTLIEAPSGFGKTTVLDYYFSFYVSKSVSCYAYDFESDEPLFIWHKICEVIGNVDAECGKALKSCGQPDEDNLSEIGEILKRLYCPDECYIWLDNYKRWNNSFSGTFLELLSKHGGKNLHVVISTQPLSSDKKSRIGSLTGLLHMCDEDLVFNKEDISAYFDAAGVSLSSRLVNEVYDLTEGWIMALCLQLLCYVDSGEFKEGSMMFLLEHVFWERLSDKEKDFLLRISIFPKFNLSQASAISGFSGDETDRMLRDQRYFIHFDPNSRCFYPHSQLKVLLKEQFDCLPKDIQKEIYMQAGKLSEMERDRLNTVRFYYSAGEWEEIFKLSLTSYEIADLMLNDIHTIVLDLLANTPMDVKLRYPRAMLSLAFALFIMGENEKLISDREELAYIIENGQITEEEKNCLKGEMELLLSFLEYNRISDMSRLHKKALELLKGPARLINHRSIWTFGSPSILYLYWRETGKLDEELAEMDTCMPIYYRLSNGHGSGAEYIMRAEAYAVRGEVNEALPLCYQALFVAQSHHQDSIYQCGLFLLSRIALQTGDMELMENTMDTFREIASSHREDISRYTIDLVEGYLAILKGKKEDVVPWLSNGDISEKRLVMMVQPFAYIIYGRCLLLSKEYHKLLGVSRYFMGLSSIFPNLLTEVYIYLYSAEAWLNLANEKEAVENLQKAIDIAIPDRVYMPFAESYKRIKNLFAMTSIERVHLRKIEKMSQQLGTLNVREEEPFTPREREILLLIKDNLTNKEIAERLNLSPNTIRNIVSVMLKKRGFRTRIQLQNLK